MGMSACVPISDGVCMAETMQMGVSVRRWSGGDAAVADVNVTPLQAGVVLSLDKRISITIIERR